MKKITFAVCFLLLVSCCLSHISPAFAFQSLKISPRTIRIIAKPGAVVDAPFVLENPTDREAVLSYSFEPFKSDSSGRIEYLDTVGKNNSPIPATQLQENGTPLASPITLGAREKKNLTLHIPISNDQKESDYYFSILFISANSSDVSENSSFIQTGVGTNVIVSVGSKTPQGSIDEFSAPLWQDHGPIPFVVKIANSGIHAFSPKGYILITNMFGQTVGKVDLQDVTILSNESRLIPEDTHSLKTDELKNLKKINADPDRAYWPEKPTFGLYKADLYISYFPNGQIQHRTIHFLSFPLPQAALTVLLIVISYLLIRRALRYSR